MKQSELRLGNYATDNIQTGIITVFNNDTCVLKHKSGIVKCKVSNLNSIPLTEEWLLKFGFITFDSKQIYNEWFLNFDGILKYKIFHSKYTGVEEFTMPHSDKPIKLKHVHQLQNLYFALTGEELTFKSE